ncbi:ATP-binding protein [Streptomyces sp. CL12-4]|jgi:anti-sigma regulatory factor (Ser/Thr protein kinase)|uniref:ATP-binding protein n=1 Tax=Streptomyces sp. CL12-4 TaxID=2810306 RepID=UPI001EFAE6BF|nr:ATP-binding protein [Streptomyces sp. CL12-4]MCG8970199.1 ATP-binding protein [Streptomyces sp. CL12-4]
MTALSIRESLAVLACGPGVERAVVEIESCERNVGKARRFAREQLVGWGLPEDDELVDRVLLVVSELVTNAILHGRTRSQTEIETVGVALALKRDFALGIMVTDNSCGIPLVNVRPSVSSISGRGLALVNAQSDGWTAAPCCGRDGVSGKAVWAFFECPQLASLPESMHQSASSGGAVWN